MYNTGYFGDFDATNFQGTMWWHISLHFGFRARDESRKLKLGDIKLERDAVRGECLVLLKERGTGRPGMEKKTKRKGLTIQLLMEHPETVVL